MNRHRACRSRAAHGERARQPQPGSPALPARDCWMGETPQRRGGWGCPAPSSPMPIEACRDGGSLPSTSKERGSTSALRWPWPQPQAGQRLGRPGPLSGPTAISCPATLEVSRTRMDRHRERRNRLRIMASCSHTDRLRDGGLAHPPPTRFPAGSQRQQPHIWRTRFLSATFPSRRSCSPSREESNDGTHETKSALLRRRRMGPEPGPGVSRSQDRHLPDGVARERAQAHPVAGTPRMGEGEEAGGRVRRRIRRPGPERQGGSRARAAHAGGAS